MDDLFSWFDGDASELQLLLLFRIYEFFFLVVEDDIVSHLSLGTTDAYL